MIFNWPERLHLRVRIRYPAVTLYRFTTHKERFNNLKAWVDSGTGRQKMMRWGGPLDKIVGRVTNGRFWIDATL